MKKIILFNIFIFFALLIFMETCLSIIFNIKDVREPLTLSKSAVDFPYVYYTFIPEKKNGSVVVNGDGLYTRYERQKPEGTIRIILTGGSTARGMFASDYNFTIAAILERLLLKEFPNQKIEVINAGMSGYVVEQLFIFYQLVLSKYQPDIVVGLNGYNDLMSVKLNRYSKIYFVPQNMIQFRVIEEGKKKNTFMGRISNIFPSTFRAAAFIKNYLMKQSQYNYSTLTSAKISNASAVYSDIINDMHSFCGAHGVSHIEFLQPVRWYVRDDREESLNRSAVPELIDLYKSYEERLNQIDYGYSLTDSFKGKEEFFLDDCHLSDKGCEIIASLMLIPIKKVLTEKLKERI